MPPRLNHCEVIVMADVKLNPVFEGMSRKIGDLVFVRQNGRTFVKRLGEWNGEATGAQKLVRDAFARMAGAWKLLSEAARLKWDSAARKGAMSGYNLFMKTNMKSLKDGRALTLLPAGDSGEGQAFTASAGATGEIICTLTESLPQKAPGLTLYLQPVESGGAVEKRPWEAATGITMRVTGLIHGGGYYLHLMAEGENEMTCSTVNAKAGE